MLEEKRNAARVAMTRFMASALQPKECDLGKAHPTSLLATSVAYRIWFITDPLEKPTLEVCFRTVLGCFADSFFFQCGAESDCSLGSVALRNRLYDLKREHFGGLDL